VENGVPISDAAETRTADALFVAEAAAFLLLLLFKADVFWTNAVVDFIIIVACEAIFFLKSKIVLSVVVVFGPSREDADKREKKIVDRLVKNHHHRAGKNER